MANPPPENLRYPFGMAVPSNFRWKGKFTEADESWWSAYGRALEDAHRDWDSDERAARDRRNLAMFEMLQNEKPKTAMDVIRDKWGDK